MAKAHYLTEADVRILKQVVADFRNRPERVVRDEDKPHPRADIYLAKSPSGGISAFSSGSGTPGSATCDIYRPDGSDGTDAPVDAGFDRVVLNYTSSAIAEGDFVPCVRDKLKGVFIVAAGTGGSTNVCDDIKAYTNAGDMPLTGVSLVTIEGSDCKLRDWDVCELLYDLTERTWNTDVKVVGVDTAADPDECGLYPLGDVYDAICALTAVVRYLVETQHSLGSTDICPP